MSGRRRLRSFSRQRRNSRWIDGGVFAGSAVQSGSFVITKASVCEIVSPSNKRFPVSISHRTTPNDQMSDRLSADLPLACSGDMYAAVPRMTPARVAASVRVGECVALTSCTPGPWTAAARPKSRTFTVGVRRDLDVRRLQIAVDHALVVRGFQRFGDLARDRQSLVERDGPA
jgi:hypothetical protein